MRELKIEVDKEMYPLEVIQQTCHVFSDSAAPSCSVNQKKVHVSLKFKRELTKVEIEEMEGKFLNELLHQGLRFKIAKSSKKIRETMIGQALCGAYPRRVQPQQQEVSEEDAAVSEGEMDKELEEILKEVEAQEYKDDPLGIAVPWEEKYKEKEEKNAQP